MRTLNIRLGRHETSLIGHSRRTGQGIANKWWASVCKGPFVHTTKFRLPYIGCLIPFFFFFFFNCVLLSLCAKSGYYPTQSALCCMCHFACSLLQIIICSLLFFVCKLQHSVRFFLLTMCYSGFVSLCVHSYLLWAFSPCTHLTRVLFMLWVLGEEGSAWCSSSPS